MIFLSHQSFYYLLNCHFDTINIFSVPAMSSELEKVFSRAKNTFFNNQAPLTMSTIQATLCFKSWFCSGLFTKKDINRVIPDFIS